MALAITERQAREIEVFCQIARENGAVISLRELIGLAAIDASEPEVATAFSSDTKLSSKFLLESGYVLEKLPVEYETPRQTVEEEERRRERAWANLRKADRFGRSLISGTVVLSVSGANSFLSAMEDEDIDFFCVTRTNGLWPFLLKALILARIHRLSTSDVPELCFSCIMDEEWARKEFSSKQKPIFARDALTAKVIGGKVALDALIEEAEWMKDYFPTFYRMRLRETSPEDRRSFRDEAEKRRAPSVLNYLVYLTLGSFLKMKSWALNRKFTKAARHSAIFTTKIGPGHYIYESNRYRKLRRMYGELETSR